MNNILKFNDSLYASCSYDFSQEIHRFAVAGSISKRPAHRFEYLKKGDYIDINPIHRHPGWKHGEIRRLDKKSGQIQVVYESMDKNYLCWGHLDDAEAIAEFTTKAGKMNSTQLEIASSVNQSAFSVPANPPASNAADHVASASLDEMEAFQRIRAKRFPRALNEQIANKYQIGDWLEVQDTQTLHWIKATVIDRENNWIVVHFDGWPSKYDQKIHAVKHEKRLRDLQDKAVISENQQNEQIEEKKEDDGDVENVSEMTIWFRDTLGLPQYLEVFKQQGFERLDTLIEITESHLKQLGIDKMGHRMMILKGIRELNQEGVQVNDDNDADQESEGTPEVMGGAAVLDTLK